jgi:hypothetical protein
MSFKKGLESLRTMKDGALGGVAEGATEHELVAAEENTGTLIMLGLRRLLEAAHHLVVALTHLATFIVIFLRLGGGEQ